MRSKVRGTHDRPRLSILRSVRHLTVQLIDDAAGLTIASASDILLTKEEKGAKAMPRRTWAYWVGEEIARRAHEKGIISVRFDRGSYRYHGLVKAIADGARKGGLSF